MFLALWLSEPVKEDLSEEALRSVSAAAAFPPAALSN